MKSLKMITIKVVQYRTMKNVYYIMLSKRGRYKMAYPC
jgi:hypothetical protein